MKGLGGRHRQLDPLVVVHGAIGVDKPLLGTPARLVLADPDADADRQQMIVDLKRLGHGHNASQLSLTGIVFIGFFTLYFCGLGFTQRG